MTRKRRASDRAEDESTFDIEHRPRTGIMDWNLGLIDQRWCSGRSDQSYELYQI
ncbi:hypothetical protein HBI56_005920 [Parastagonospora nodorum]|nr:hypothetical protein HBH51_037840 [Parastagonospora nodorum]KAH4005406.1 hypothetical protein HBI10_032760 [Parastagonospora nodorum]KAH4033118.1 hypothetical protein HBI13_006340 [Parastagonospora nodorum]KAH4041922.1 hypothetical protein HBI09_006240 [Parastagonospora nodorum]KAH4073557.1 hypothetical protein HBH50_055760 [Parastagonospora nodorum]